MEGGRKKISWIKLSSRRYGGAFLGVKAREALSERFDVELKNIEAKNRWFKYLKPFEWFFALFFKLKGNSDLWVRDDLFSIAALSKKRTKGKNLAVIYHIDSSVFPLIFRPLFFLIEKISYYNLKKVDAILTISEYWKNYFLKKGYKNVYKIYSPFNLPEFNIPEEELLEFRNKHGLVNKPIIYLGNRQKAKGVVEAYEALKDLDAHLVTSGEEMVKIPALNLNLDYRDYLKLLKVSSVVITMSKFKEGWCITTHEAMLLKTPVIGSGLGGMEELLKGGKQIICQDFNSLRRKVEYLLENPTVRKEMGENGFNFAKNFTLERFEEEWLKLIEKIL